jgi:hypothetical protein
MSLQSCPTCGYALSIHDHHCRHCLPSRSGFAKADPLFDMKHLSTIIVAVLALSVLAYFMFLR